MFVPVFPYLNQFPSPLLWFWYSFQILDMASWPALLADNSYEAVKYAVRIMIVKLKMKLYVGVFMNDLLLKLTYHILPCHFYS